MPRIKNILLILIGLVIGYLTSPLIFKHTQFSISRNIVYQIDLGGLVSIAATIFIAIYVTKVLAKQNEEDRVEKNLLIDDLKNFKERLNEDTYSLLDKNTVSGSLVAEKFKSLRMNLTSTLNLLKKYSFIEKTNLTGITLDQKVRDIKDLLTDNSTDEDGTIIIAGEITYGAARKQAVQKTLSEFNELVFELTMIINKKKL